MKRMTHTQYAHWKTHRKLGVVKFVLLYGIIITLAMNGFGEGIKSLMRGEPIEVMPAWEIALDLVARLPFGMLISHSLWRLAEEKFQLARRRY